MTYGEYWTAVKMSKELVEGKWTVSNTTKHIPKRMSKKEASEYYKKKFDDYWAKSDQKI